ncbi:MAG: CBS domain-containing protein [Candidatus Ranarchaeia archaeon]
MVKDVIMVKEGITAEKAIETLYNKHIGSLIIIDEEKRCIGIFTERDAIRIVVQKVPLDTPLHRVMTKNVVTIPGDDTFENAKKIMVSQGIRHLPVTDSNQKVIGLLAIRSCLAELFGTGS